MFACIFIPDFSVKAIIRFEPELRARCVTVLGGRPPLEKVVALNEKARQTGVEIGATRAQLEAWEELVLRTRSQAQEDSAHAALLDCAQSFSPEIEDTAPNTVLLNLAGLEPLFARHRRLPATWPTGYQRWNWKRTSPWLRIRMLPCWRRAVFPA